MAISYSGDKALSPRKVQALFRRLVFSDWWSQKDIEWYLNAALRVVSAWDRQKLVGMGILTGDGRIDVHLSLLVVDAPYQRQGIGTAIISRLVGEVEAMRPYSFQTDVFSEDAERLYARFGFQKNAGTWLLEHEPTFRRWVDKARTDRERRRSSDR